MKRLLWLFLLLPAGILLGQTDPAELEDTGPPIHDARVDDLGVSIYRMYLTEDYEPIRAALRKLQDDCRELKVEERDRYGSTVVDYDRSFHRALDRTRELASAGEWDDSEKQYDWVLRSCVGCHRASRKAGFGPPVPLP
jgi:hypothetical protein